MRLRVIPVVLAALIAVAVFWLASGKDVEEAAPVPVAPVSKPRGKPGTPVPEIVRAAEPPTPAPPPLARFELQVVNVEGNARRATVRLKSGDQITEVETSRRGALKGWLVPGRYTFDTYFDHQYYGIEQGFEAGQTHKLVLTVGRKPVGVRGFVVGIDDQPLLDVQLSYEGLPNTVSTGGHFEFETDKKELWITVSKSGYARETVRVEPPTEDVKIVLRTSADISVAVVDTAGAAVFDALVDLSSGTLHHPNEKKLTTEKPILVRNVPSGPMKVRAVRMTAEGLERGSTEIALVAGQLGEAVVKLQPATGLEGTVTSKGAPLEGVRVVALAPTGRVLTPFERSVMSAAVELEDAEGSTDRQGHFDLKPLKLRGPDTRYRIYVLGPGLREPEHPVLLELGGMPVKLALVPLSAE